jgi:LysR family transcriptional regulator, low CO2-responsive transcriptional regulator
MKNATFRQLRVFNEVARHLSFVRAAEALHLTPPAVTMQIKELEGHLGMALFDRTGKKIRLTTAGEYMLLYARRILATIKDAEDAAARLQRAEVGILTVGMVGTSKYFMMRMLSEFKKRHEGVDLRVVTGNREQLVMMLQANEVDIAVMGRPPRELRYRAEPFAVHPLVFVAATENRLYQRSLVEPIDAEDLRYQHFIVREHGSGTRAVMQQFFDNARIEPSYKIQLNSNETIKQAVMADLGLGFLSLHTIGSEIKQNEIGILNVAGTPIFRAWNLVHTQSKMLSPAAEALRYFVLENAETTLGSMFGDIKLN